MISNLLFLDAFTKHDGVEVHSYCSMCLYFIPFSGYIILYCMNVCRICMNHILSFIWIDSLITVYFGYCKQLLQIFMFWCRYRLSFLVCLEVGLLCLWEAMFTCLLFFFKKSYLLVLGWLWTCDPFSSESWWLALQVCTITPVFSKSSTTTVEYLYIYIN